MIRFYFIITHSKYFPISLIIGIKTTTTFLILIINPLCVDKCDGSFSANLVMGGGGISKFFSTLLGLDFDK